MKKEKLNKKDTEKVSGGTVRLYDDPTKGAYIKSDGKTYDVFCDACGERISGFPKPVTIDFSSVGLGAKLYCLKCYLALDTYVRKHPDLSPTKVQFDINPDFDPSK